MSLHKSFTSTWLTSDFLRFECVNKHFLLIKVWVLIDIDSVLFMNCLDIFLSFLDGDQMMLIL